jgi:hypothetical protein
MAESVDLEAVAADVKAYSEQMIQHNAQTTKDGIWVDTKVKEINAYTGKPGQVTIPQ